MPELLVATAFGLEKIAAREIEGLGYECTVAQPGRLLVVAEPLAIARLNLNLRTADRVLIRLGHFPAADFEALFETTRELPWEVWIPPDGEFPVAGKSVRSQLSSVPAIQRSVKKAIVERLRHVHQTSELPESGARHGVEVSLLKDVATLTLDTTGPSLHKRGYRDYVGQAPIKETLAAALLLISRWTPERPLADPFCGTGSIPIEAALLGRRIAPGLHRTFSAAEWPLLDPRIWSEARAEAESRISPALPLRIIAQDASAEQLRLARRHGGQAGVNDDIHWQQREFANLSSKQDYGCVVTNPPYGLRLGERAEVDRLYREIPLVLRKLPTWSHFILTARDDFERLVGRRADRRRKLYNGRIACTLYQFFGPLPPRASAPQQEGQTDPNPTASDPPPDADAAESQGAANVTAAKPAEPPRAFGGISDKGREEAERFAARLAKLARHLRRYPGRGITCYRLYERDVPEIPLVVDRYEDCLHLTEYERPHERSPGEHADWLDLMAATAATTLGVERRNVYLKSRHRQRGAAQYERVGDEERIIEAHEGGLKFLVNLSDYVDTGLFLDHRLTRDLVRREAADRRMLNLFAYTGAFSVYAADGGAASTLSIDWSNTYLRWAEENLALNECDPTAHRVVRADARSFLAETREQFGLVVVDPPTFSNRKGVELEWDVQRDHADLLEVAIHTLTPGGILYFSTNFRRFQLDEARLTPLVSDLREITKQTIPPEYRNRRIHRCWRLVR